MKLKVAFQVDKNLDFTKDSSVYLTQEAQKRGHIIFYYHTEDLYMHNGQVGALCNIIEVKENMIIFKDSMHMNLDEVDIILMRQDPPFNMRYITTTYLLEKCKTLVINNPTSVRNNPEKILKYGDFLLPTIITEKLDLIKEFYLQYESIVLKPLYSFGGNNVVQINSLDSLDAVARMMLKLYNEPIIAQKFFPEVAQYGDKRVFLLDGKILGTYKRISTSGFRTNTALGGMIESSSLSEKEHEICELIGTHLSCCGIILAGIDLIGERYLGEINVTSPTGLTAIRNLSGKNVAADCWNCFESKL